MGPCQRFFCTAVLSPRRPSAAAPAAASPLLWPAFPFAGDAVTSTTSPPGPLPRSIRVTTYEIESSVSEPLCLRSGGKGDFFDVDDIAALRQPTHAERARAHDRSIVLTSLLLLRLRLATAPPDPGFAGSGCLVGAADAACADCFRMSAEVLLGSSGDTSGAGRTHPYGLLAAAHQSADHVEAGSAKPHPFLRLRTV